MKKILFQNQLIYCQLFCSSSLCASVHHLWSKDNKTVNGQGIMQVISLLCVKHSDMIAVRTMKQPIILYSVQVLNDVW